jgi:murein DD-endopeptidase MepM/ murein hydrolase activator NlpD
MNSEPPRRDSLPPLRPLPSVHLPLLRTERSAVRNRRIARAAIAATAIALLGGGSAIALYYRGEKRADAVRATSDVSDLAASVALEPAAPAVEPPLPTTPAVAASVEQPAPRSAGRHERTLGRSRSFGEALRRAGMDSEEADGVVAAFTKLVDFRHVHPEDLIVIERAGDGQLTRFEYRATPTIRYEAVRTPSGWQGSAIKLAIDTVRIARGGVVEGALGDALEGLELGRALTGLFADVFSGDVNFSSDTRSGDSFRVIVDEEHLEGKFLRYGTVYALEYHGERAGVLRAFWHESKQIEGDFFDEQGRALHGGWLRTPLRYDHVSSGFGMRFHPVLKRKQLHNGIDYSAPTGTTVRAAAAGVVRLAAPSGPNGNLIAIVHPHGYESFYAHLSRFAPGIRAGVRVKQRQLIAYVGSTGRSTGPHLHFALKKGGRFVNPNTQLNGPGLPLPAGELSDYKRRVRELLTELSNIPLQQPAPVTPPPEIAAPLELGEEEL